jgi:pilus assembly protein Flp/PilA
MVWKLLDTRNKFASLEQGRRELDFPEVGTRRPEMFRKLIKNNKGATAIEYGLIAALIAVAAIAALGTVGSQLTKTFNKVGGELTNANT